MTNFLTHFATWLLCASPSWPASLPRPRPSPPALREFRAAQADAPPPARNRVFGQPHTSRGLAGRSALCNLASASGAAGALFAPRSAERCGKAPAGLHGDSLWERRPHGRDHADWTRCCECRANAFAHWTERKEESRERLVPW